VATACHDPARISLAKKENIGRLLDRVLVTSKAMTPEETHVSGFDLRAWNAYLGRSANDRSTINIARGDVLGASRPVLEVATAVFDTLVKLTLAAGHMGTDEHLLT
jgi:hypothetical protein